MIKSKIFGIVIALIIAIAFNACKPSNACEGMNPEFTLLEGLGLPYGDLWRDTLIPTQVWIDQEKYYLKGPDGWDNYEWKIISPEDTTYILFGQEVQIQVNFNPSNTEREIQVELILSNGTSSESCTLTQSFPFFDLSALAPNLFTGSYRGSSMKSPTDTFEFEITKEEIVIGPNTIHDHYIRYFPASCRFSFSVQEKYSAFFVHTRNQTSQGCERLRASGIFDEETNRIWIKYQTKEGQLWEEDIFTGEKIFE